MDEEIQKKGVVSLGFHSEGLIAQHLVDLQSPTKKTMVHQIYTERPPCVNCAMLLNKYSEVPIFHSLRPGEETKAEKLMEAYGIVVR